MGWLARLFGAVSKEEMRGLHLDLERNHWETSGAQEFPTLLRALQGLLPSDAILYFEDGSPRGDLKPFLERVSVPEPVHLAYGTIWPSPRVFHVPATDENLATLAELSEHCAEPELAIHFHVYVESEVLLEWHDAFSQPMLLSGRFSETEVKRFCEELSMSYKSRGESKNGSSS